MSIPKEAIEAAARALAPGINWDNGLEPGPYKKMALEDAELALTAALPHLAEPQICGACGDPWTGQTCGQKDNGWPHPTCLPVSAQHLAEPSESDRDRIKEACSDCHDFKDGQRECCRAWDCDFVIDALTAIRAEATLAERERWTAMPSLARTLEEVRLAEREVCAKVADGMAGWLQPRDVAASIRARK